MLHSLCRIGLTAALFGLLFVPSVALAQDKRVRHVQDDANLFSKEAIGQANAVVAKIKEKHKKDLFIETVAEGPEKDFPGWARSRFNNAAVDGVYVVLTKKPKRLQIDVGDATLRNGYFTRQDIKELETIVKAKGTNDEVLNKIVTFVHETMNERHKPKAVAQQPKENPAPVQKAQPPPVQDRGQEVRHDTAMPSWVGWVCAILAVVFVVWIIFAVIRAMTGMGGGGYGYGGGGGGMGYGGGGGGFLTGMLGGMFGAMAGMWMYNNFFGGHASMGSNGAVNWGGGGTNAAGEPYQGDTDVGASGGGEYGGGDDAAAGGEGDGGAEWGGKDEAGGGDAGGGGDWGGGGDGGGGDWGGGGDAGGGDWGGGGDAGGGGDWGGGGGGDFGGGGGGGGDW